MLATAAHTAVQIVAMQDQRTMTPEIAMELVGTNIHAGNQHALGEILTKTAGQA